ncbi:unnamed protein product [Rhizophagus irregularis]|uniref:Uncharacterized protein n=1 Tax=Rhizophagus irregularis TaxID=588596 RepID=A0A916E379_9GLOM|nr:unnamed protein product [Rhizophagus irregularis]CAB5358733.1 unnamed protein product [Rhizophagus irregularis]
MQYQVKETPSSAICGKEYIQKNAFTGNAISHLRLKYDITQTEEKLSKGIVLTMKRKNHSKQRQIELRQFLVDWVVLDSQPLSTVQSKTFWHFIHKLDSAFIMPSQETDTLKNILHEWDIRDKIFTITTDNASNMKKCVQDMEGVNWLGCTVHTLQLVVGKGMKPAEVLIARAKQLINFFMRPKQSERFKDVQSRFPELADELELQITLQNTEEDNEENEQEKIVILI